MKCADVSAAFLQGHRLPEQRNLHVQLPRGYPPEVTATMVAGLPAGSRSHIVKLVKGGFGLPGSPRLWYLAYKDVLTTKLSFRECRLLPGVFVRHHDDGRLRAVAAIHVDDTRMAGDDTAEEIWEALRKLLAFGEWREADGTWIKFCGRYERRLDNGDYQISMDSYGAKLQLVAVRPPTVAAGPLTDNERTLISSALGQLNWQARQGRPDLSYGVSEVQQKLKDGSSELLQDINTLIRKARQPCALLIGRVAERPEQLLFVAATDAAYGAMPRGGSQAGIAVLAAGPQVLEGEGQVALLEFASTRCKRVVRSPMAAELSALATSHDHATFVRAAFAEIWGTTFQLRTWRVPASGASLLS